MTREESIKWLESLKAEIGKAEHRTLWHYAEAIDMAIEALTHDKRTETHACDSISRQAAIDATWFEPSYTDPLNVLTEVRDRLKVLPSAEPVKHGEWIESKIPNELYTCSNCGGACWSYDYERTIVKSNFCPYCGAKMDKGGDTE